MLADDQARRVHGELPLARALARMTTPRTGSSEAGVLALADTAVVHRLERLLHGADERSRWIPAVAYSIASLLLSGPVAVLIAPLLCVVIWPV
ncbi:hypothetical protein [Microbispora sp. CA-102843]|uniref:hypothetical protein n=1 Tax=Microbispora sp. CA-102843 TaxID=3239952 RepID=UPI003D94ADCE